MTKSMFDFPDQFGTTKYILLRLNKLLGDVVISQGGVVPHISPEVSRSQFQVSELVS